MKKLIKSYSVEDTHIEVITDDNTYYLQLPHCPDSIHTDVDKEIDIKDIREICDELVSNFKDTSTAAMCFAAGFNNVESITETFDKDLNCYIFELATFNETAKVKLSNCSDYYNVEMYDLIK